MRFSRKSYDWRISMKSFIKTMSDLPFIIKLILCIPVLDIVWNITRLCRSIDKKNLLGIVLAALAIFPGAGFVWIVDILCVIIKKDIWWID